MKKFYLFFLLIFFSIENCFSQDSITPFFRLNKLPPEGVLLDKDWKFISGDNPAYADSEYNDAAWEPIDPTLDIYDLPQIPESGIVWFRLRLLIDTSVDKQLMLIIQQSGASEIYLDGQLIHHFGILSPNPANVKACDPLWKPVSFPVTKNTTQVLAVRFAREPHIRYTTMFNTTNHALWIQIKDVESAVSFYHQQASRFTWLHIIIIGVCFLFCVLHFAFYLFYPSQKANFYFALFALFIVTAIVLQHTFYLEAQEIKYKFFLANFSFAFFLVGNLFLITAIHYLLKQKKDIYYWSLVFYVIISFFLNAGPYKWGWIAGGILAQNLINFNILRISLLALRREKRGAWIIVAGAILYTISFVIFIAQVELVNVDLFLTISALSAVLFNMTELSIPMAASIYLGLEFAFVNDSLQQKLKEVNELSEKNLAQEREKQQFLALQNETLERQVGERTTELSQSLKELKETQTQLIQQEKMASLGELTAGIAHEIQNPLNFVNNFSEVNREMLVEMRDEMDKGNIVDAKAIANDVIDNEEKINYHGKRADSIVKGMLQHSRKSTGEKVPTDINLLADEYLRLSYHGLRSKDNRFNAILKTDFDPSVGRINIIPQDIGRVLLNMYNNAFYEVSAKSSAIANAKAEARNLLAISDPQKAAADAVNEKQKEKEKEEQPWEPQVTVSTKKKGNEVIITVKDNGNGVSQNIINKIFQPFFTTKPTGQGTGLGLSLAYDIVKAHGGDIKVTSSEGSGSEFLITLNANS